MREKYFYKYGRKSVKAIILSIVTLVFLMFLIIKTWYTSISEFHKPEKDISVKEEFYLDYNYDTMNLNENFKDYPISNLDCDCQSERKFNLKERSKYESLCSNGATARGEGQKILSYSLFGNIYEVGNLSPQAKVC